MTPILHLKCPVTNIPHNKHKYRLQCFRKQCTFYEADDCACQDAAAIMGIPHGDMC